MKSHWKSLVVGHHECSKSWSSMGDCSEMMGGILGWSPTQYPTVLLDGGFPSLKKLSQPTIPNIAWNIKNVNQSSNNSCLTNIWLLSQLLFTIINGKIKPYYILALTTMNGYNPPIITWLTHVTKHVPCASNLHQSQPIVAWDHDPRIGQRIHPLLTSSNFE